MTDYTLCRACNNATLTYMSSHSGHPCCVACKFSRLTNLRDTNLRKPDMTEQELRAEAKRTATKLAALDWLDEKSKSIPKNHTDSCAYMDDTGYPAPCTCGFSKNEDVNVLRFLREAVLSK